LEIEPYHVIALGAGNIGGGSKPDELDHVLNGLRFDVSIVEGLGDNLFHIINYKLAQT